MKRYKYKMKNKWITGTQIGEITPIFHQEVTPNDIWHGKTTAFVRMAPLNIPTMMSLKCFVHFFFVPHRTVWPEFEDEYTGAAAATWPTITAAANHLSQDLLTYFGIHPNPTAGTVYNALPIRAFNEVVNEFFTDPEQTQRTTDQLDVPLCNFPSSNYFMKATSEIQQSTEETIDTSQPTLGITEVWKAQKRQRLKERRAHYGERFEDMLLADYGVQPSSARLNRPEHIGRGAATMGISEVVATASSTGENTGDYKGHGIVGINCRIKPRKFTEPGTIIGIMYSRPDQILKKRADHQWFVQDKEDLYIPSLANDTPINLSSLEVWNEGAGSNWAYADRHEYLRSARHTIAGKMNASTEDEWTAHQPLVFAPPPNLLRYVPNYAHIFQDTSSDASQLKVLALHNISKHSIVKPRTI